MNEEKKVEGRIIRENISHVKGRDLFSVDDKYQGISLGIFYVYDI